MALQAFNWLERKWSAAGDLAPEARLALHRRCRIASAATILCFVPPMLLLGSEPLAVIASLLLFGVLPAVAVMDARKPELLNRALLMSLVAAAAVLMAGVLRGLHPLFAVVALAALTLETIIAGDVKTRRPALAGLAVTTVGITALFAAPELVPAQEGIALSTIALTTACAVTIAMITHALRSGLNSHQSATDSQQARLAEAESIISDVVVGTDRSGSVLRVSGNAERVLGLPGESLKGRGLAELALVADRPELLTALCDCAHGGNARTLRLRLRVSAEREAPRYRWIELRVAASPAGDGMAVAALRDISAETEEEARVASIASEASAAKDARAAFLSTVNHELRTPLNAIIGFSELLANPMTTPQNPERLQEYARLINGAGQDLLRMITAMIDITRLDSGIYDFEAEQAELAPLIESALDAFRQEPEAKNSTFTFKAPAEATNAKIDQRAFRQVLTQLLSNATKFGGTAGPITVSLTSGTDWISIAIADKGPGIQPEKLEKLGRHFERLDESLARERGGVGLGLSLASGLMALHGGKVAIDSKQGVGTTVTLSLPHATTTPVADASNILTLAKPKAPTTETLTTETTTTDAAPQRRRA